MTDAEQKVYDELVRLHDQIKPGYVGEIYLSRSKINVLLKALRRSGSLRTSWMFGSPPVQQETDQREVK